MLFVFAFHLLYNHYKFRQPNLPPILNCFTHPLKTALIICVTFSLYACQENQNDVSNDEPKVKSHDETLTSTINPLEANSKESNLNEDLDIGKDPVKMITELGFAETQTLEGNPKELGLNENSDKTKDPVKMITELGFSETQTIDTKPPVPEKYCLNESIDTSPIAKKAVEHQCEKISNRLASVSMENCTEAKLEVTGCHSVLKFPILLRDFPPTPNKLPKGRILVIGGTHADELTSVSTVFKWISTLNKHHSGLFHWHIAPLMNPDGLFKKSATRTNENGVDLNRNMPSDDWYDHALLYWETKGGKNPRKFPGNEPSSEPETQWLIDEINDFKPDAIISVHAPYGIVDFDSLLLKTAPRSLGKLHLNFLGTYPGSLGNYAGINLNIPVITVELPHAWEMPSDSEIAKIWQDIVSWLKTNVNEKHASNQ